MVSKACLCLLLCSTAYLSEAHLVQPAKRKQISVHASSAEECQREVNSELWRTFDDQYSKQTWTPVPKDACENYESDVPSFLPKYVLHGTRGVDPERGWAPPAEVNFTRLRSGLQTVTVTKSYEPGKTLEVLEWTAAYAFDTQSNEISTEPGYVGVFRLENCEVDACFVEKTGFLAVKYAPYCTKGEDNIVPDTDWQLAGKVINDANQTLCSNLWAEKYAEEGREGGLVFLRSDTCKLVLDSVYEVRCLTQAASAANHSIMV